MSKFICKNNKEKGLISLFVLLACLFFVFVLVGTYLFSLNKLEAQEQEVQQIQENYAKDLDKVEEMYYELKGE